MGRYNFVPPGGGTDLFQEILQREMMRRQMRQQEQALIDAQQERALRQKQIEATIENTRLTREGLQDERDFRRATTRVENAWPGEALTPEEATGLRKQGYSGQILETQPGREFDAQDPTTGENLYHETPGILSLRGGSKYLTQRAAEEAKAEAARAKAQSDLERAREREEARAREEAADRRSREAIAGVTASIAQQGVNIRADAERRQQATADAAKAETTERKRLGREAAIASAQETTNALSKLITVDPKTGRAELIPWVGTQLFGARVPFMASLAPGGTQLATAKAALNQLRARTVVDLINEMKQQSRTGATGLGALNEGERVLLQQSADIINQPGIDDDTARAALENMWRLAQKVIAGAGTGGDNIDATIDELLKEPPGASRP